MATLKLTVFDPIEIIIGEETYKIETISSRLLGDLRAMVDKFSGSAESVKPEQMGDILVKLLPGMTQEKAAEIDIRHIVKIAEFLAEQIMEASQPGQAKN